MVQGSRVFTPLLAATHFALLRRRRQLDWRLLLGVLLQARHGAEGGQLVGRHGHACSGSMEGRGAAGITCQWVGLGLYQRVDALLIPA